MGHLIICDIQPEYEWAMRFRIVDSTQYLNRVASRYNKVTYFYNGAETLGMISEVDLIDWLIDNGLNEKALYRINFHDKGYGFLRQAMDCGVSHDLIVKALKTMKDLCVWDSLDLPEEQRFLYGLDDCKMLSWNDAYDIMYNTRSGNIVFVGGGSEECLKELELGAMALGLRYKFNNRFVY